jgi:hypothetical protein
MGTDTVPGIGLGGNMRQYTVANRHFAANPLHAIAGTNRQNVEQG